MYEWSSVITSGNMTEVMTKVFFVNMVDKKFQWDYLVVLFYDLSRFSLCKQSIMSDVTLCATRWVYKHNICNTKYVANCYKPSEAVMIVNFRRVSNSISVHFELSSMSIRHFTTLIIFDTNTRQSKLLITNSFWLYTSVRPIDWVEGTWFSNCPFVCTTCTSR